ncbi:hypothetical protein D3C80_1080500 [compost metagenome]
MGELDVYLLHHDVVEHVGRRRHVAPASGHQHHIVVELPRAGEQPCPVRCRVIQLPLQIVDHQAGEKTDVLLAAVLGTAVDGCQRGGACATAHVAESVGAVGRQTVQGMTTEHRDIAVHIDQVLRKQAASERAQTSIHVLRLRPGHGLAKARQLFIDRRLGE